MESSTVYSSGPDCYCMAPRIKKAIFKAELVPSALSDKQLVASAHTNSAVSLYTYFDLYHINSALKMAFLILGAMQ